MIIASSQSIDQGQGSIRIMGFPRLFFFHFYYANRAKRFFMRARMILRDSNNRHFQFVFSFSIFLNFSNLIGPIQMATTFRSPTDRLIGSFCFSIFRRVVSIRGRSVIHARNLVRVIRRAHIVRVMRIQRVRYFFDFLSAFVHRHSQFKYRVSYMVLVLFRSFSRRVNSIVRYYEFFNLSKGSR